MKHNKDHSVSSRNSQKLLEAELRDEPKGDYESLLEDGAKMITRMKI